MATQTLFIVTTAYSSSVEMGNGEVTGYYLLTEESLDELNDKAASLYDQAEEDADGELDDEGRKQHESDVQEWLEANAEKLNAVKLKNAVELVNWARDNGKVELKAGFDYIW